MKTLKLINILLSISLLFTNVYGEDKEIVKKAVYDLTSGDMQTIDTRFIGSIISNSDYYHNKLQEYKVKVIVHGKAYKFFMNDLNGTIYSYDKKLIAKKEALKKRLKSLSKLYGVEFEICSIGVKHRDLNPKSFYPFTKMIHSAIVGLVDAQHDGYAYIPIH